MEIVNECVLESKVLHFTWHMRRCASSEVRLAVALCFTELSSCKLETRTIPFSVSAVEADTSTVDQTILKLLAKSCPSSKQIVFALVHKLMSVHCWNR